MLGLEGKDFPSQFVVSLESDRVQNALEIFVSDECFQGERVVTQVNVGVVLPSNSRSRFVRIVETFPDILHNIMLPGRISRAVFSTKCCRSLQPKSAGRNTGRDEANCRSVALNKSSLSGLRGPMQVLMFFFLSIFFFRAFIFIYMLL